MTKLEKPELDAKAAMRAVNQKTFSPPCPMCGTSHWLAEGGLGLLSAPTPAYLVTDLDSFWEGPPAVPALIFTCSNCGFIRLHNIAYMQGKVTTDNG